MNPKCPASKPPTGHDILGENHLKTSAEHSREKFIVGKVYSNNQIMVGPQMSKIHSIWMWFLVRSLVLIAILINRTRERIRTRILMLG